MAVQSLMYFGSFEERKAKKKLIVVACNMVFDRPYSKYGSINPARLEQVSVTVSPNSDDFFVHKWFAEKTLEDVYLVIVLQDAKGEKAQTFAMKDAVCYKLSESMVKISPKGSECRRLVELGIKAPEMKFLTRKQMDAIINKDRPVPPPPVFVPKDPRKNQAIAQRAAEMPANLTAYEKSKLAEHSILLEKEFGIQKGAPMTTEQADKQHANPFYMPKMIRNDEGKLVKNPYYNEREHLQYAVNCATCATTYALRKQGFDLTAGGMNEEVSNANAWLAMHDNVFRVWNNADGTLAKPTLVRDWMDEKGLNKLSPGNLEKFFEESTQEEGVYVASVDWPGAAGGHSTILERYRDENGELKLKWIEPQVYDGKVRHPVIDLCKRTTPWPNEKFGVMRVDNKLFNPEYKSLFNDINV